MEVIVKNAIIFFVKTWEYDCLYCKTKFVIISLWVTQKSGHKIYFEVEFKIPYNNTGRW